jgi:hypothetical protein
MILMVKVTDKKNWELCCFEGQCNVDGKLALKWKISF